MENCIFCKIVKGEIPGVKIWEDENFIAILDKFPNVKGMTLVIPKKHFDSYVFDMNDKDYKELMVVAKKVAKLLDKKLKVKRTALVMEGLGVNHAHIKLYPIYGGHEGHLTTELGPEMSIEQLNKIAEEIRE